MYRVTEIVTGVVTLPKVRRTLIAPICASNPPSAGKRFFCYILSVLSYLLYYRDYKDVRIHRLFLQFAAIWSISLYAVPVIAMFAMYQRASLTDNVSYLSKFVAGAGALLVASLAARGYSRSNNPVYVKFVQTLNEAQLHYNASTKQELHKYDFEFWAWPVDFDVLELKRLDSISPSTIIIQDVRESLTFIVKNP